jgi:hypothetical protein
MPISLLRIDNAHSTRTETWLIYYGIVPFTAGARDIYPLCSHPIPLFLAQATAKLRPCTSGSNPPCTGKLPGPSLLALPLFFSSVLGNQVYDGIYHKVSSFLAADVLQSMKHAWLALLIVR